MEKDITGVALGRFNPSIHMGHQRTIDTMVADNGSENSLIMIGSANKFEDRNPLTYPQRRHIAQVLYPEVEIMPVLDIAKDQSDFWMTMDDWREGLRQERDKRNTQLKFYGGNAEDLSYMEEDFETKTVDRTQLLLSGTQLREAFLAKDFEAVSEMIDGSVVDLMERYYKFQVAQLTNPITPFGPLHLNSRSSVSPGYPERSEVPDDKVFWELDFEKYDPEYYVAESVIKNNQTSFPPDFFLKDRTKGWAHPEDWENARDLGLIPTESLLGQIATASDGRPLNPMGRTGIEGRGLLGKWGPNLAVDPVITRNNPDTEKLELLVIERASGAWAFPGGFVDRGDTVEKTLSKELGEETSVDLNMDDAKRIYEGYVDSNRNTDNAWIETVAAHKHLTSDQASSVEPVAGDDAQDVKWLDLESDDWHVNLVGTHAQIVNMFLQNLNS